MRFLWRLLITGLLFVVIVLLIGINFIGVNDEFTDQLNTESIPKNTFTEKDDINKKQIVVNPRARSSSKPPSKLINPDKYQIKEPEFPLDSLTNKRRNKIKEMMKHAWSNYVTYAWGENELKPISMKGHSASIFGSSKMGATIVDALDTLYIMNMHEEFKQGRDWIDKNLNLITNQEMSLFETNIRFLGSLLTSFSLTGDEMFREKALQLGERMLPAFDTKTGIPHSHINFYTGKSKNNGWADNGFSILAEIGTMHLEFSYLSDITGNPIFKKKVEHVRRVLKDLDKPKGLYPNFIHSETGKWGKHDISFGALGDSFYEYLLKAWIQSGKKDTEAKIMYDDAIAAVVRNLIMTSKSGLTYLSDLHNGQRIHKMGHLACFAGGLFALGAQVNKNEMSNQYMNIGIALTNTCHESYNRSTTKLGPEYFHFTNDDEAKGLKDNEKYYILRPETYESYFILWRLTKDKKYRDWGWEAVEALEKHCRVPHGFSGITNVYDSDPIKNDVQESFFFAESLKYLYLLFSDDDLIHLDNWVFNTEAHMLPIKGKNKFYRQASNSF